MWFAVLLAILQVGVHVSSVEQNCPKGPYDKNERPNAGGPPVNITIKTYVRNLNSIDESVFTYNLDYILYYWYNDPRLSTNCSTPEFLKNVRGVNDIWFPNLGVINCHSAENVANSESVSIEANGDVFAHHRVTTQCYCIMDLSAFPMDTQHCPFRLESYIYPTTDIRLYWNTPGIEFEEGLQLVGYKQGKSNAKKFSMSYSYGTWEVMEANFVFHRNFLHYIYGVYAPIILLMIFNFASYWIPYTSEARVTLIITTFLTIVFILQSVTSQTAKATTTTSLQIFLIFSIALVVAAIMEYLLVLFLASRAEKQENKEKEEKSRKLSKIVEETTSFDNGDVQQLHRLISANDISEETMTRSARAYRVADRIDRFSAYFAPVAYVIFCLAYFGFFLHQWFDAHNYEYFEQVFHE